MTREEYREKQKMYKQLNKERGKYLWVSREKGDIKGRTYIKKDEELRKMFEEHDKKKEV